APETTSRACPAQGATYALRSVVRRVIATHAFSVMSRGYTADAQTTFRTDGGRRDSAYLRDRWRRNGGVRVAAATPDAKAMASNRPPAARRFDGSATPRDAPSHRRRCRAPLNRAHRVEPTRSSGLLGAPYTNPTENRHRRR